RLLRTFFFILLRPLPRYTLFPYTTLFRSQVGAEHDALPEADRVPVHLRDDRFLHFGHHLEASDHSLLDFPGTIRIGQSLRCFRRSEEHTSELQSRENLVCRLLLEKKNDIQ